MDILIFLIPITFCLAIAGLIAFMWNIKNKQYDDLEGAANRILFDENFTENKEEKNDKKNIKN